MSTPFHGHEVHLFRDAFSTRRVTLLSSFLKLPLQAKADLSKFMESVLSKSGKLRSLLRTLQSDFGKDQDTAGQLEPLEPNGLLNVTPRNLSVLLSVPPRSMHVKPQVRQRAADSNPSP